ncbi:hypothetical protein D7294_22865 [Streptomyces hoynatensis]|uniref:DUF4034 domain-containing protein n=2 Tax=Streptomyces hoynatensis TaxID=1141874 RepID=A0A3A9YU44_9ACTN|nr:hypothetical protein D7294_22865 [Streptomyces hoynatensis]
MLRLRPRVVRDGEEVREAAQRRDWPAVRGQLLAAPEGHRAQLLRGLEGVEGVRPWLAEVSEAGEDRALALLASGSYHVWWAWEARTGARARDVGAEQFRLFHERLRIAEEQLYEAAEREPGWAEPWHLLCQSGRGLQVGPTAAYARFEAAVRRVPEHLGAHAQYLQQVAAKWGGSDEEMHRFAHTAVAEAGPGTQLGALVPMAHLESWLERNDARFRYLRSAAVRKDLHEAADRSVRHPHYRKGADWVWQHNVFAMAFALAGEVRAARRMFRVLGGRVSPSPWHYLGGDAVRAYRRWRRLSGGAWL